MSTAQRDRNRRRTTPPFNAAPLCVVACLASLALGCAQGDETDGAADQPAPEAMTNAAAADAAKPATPRVAVVGPALVEIAYALGAGDRIVAVDGSSKRPADALADVPRVGSHRRLNVEALLAAKPTLLLTDAAVGPAGVLDQVRKAGVEVVAFDEAKGLEAAYARYDKLGAALGKQADAASAEAVIAAKPQALVIPKDGLASIGGVAGALKLPGVAQTPIAQTGRVVAVDDMDLLSFGPGLPRGLRALTAGLHGTKPGTTPKQAEAAVAAEGAQP